VTRIDNICFPLSLSLYFVSGYISIFGIYSDFRGSVRFNVRNKFSDRNVVPGSRKYVDPATRVNSGGKKSRFFAKSEILYLVL